MPTLSEIIEVIHREGVEIEVFQELSEWVVRDREQQHNDASKRRAVIKAIGKIAERNPNKKEAIEGIVNLCQTESGK